MSHDPYTLPADLPVPVDDGAADHLTGLELPDLELESSQGPVNVHELDVLYVYPRTRRPGVPSLPGWDETPGARGCTPQSCGFRDAHGELRALGKRVAGLSAQPLDDQLEFAERNRMPFPVIADPGSSSARRWACRRSRSRATSSTSGSHSSPRTAGSPRSSIPSSRPTRTRPTSSTGSAAMRLVTYDDGKVGYVDGEEIVRLDVPTMREWFERGGADETGERVALADARLRAPIVPKKFFHTAGNFREHEEESKVVDWSHQIAPWINFFQNVDAIVGPDEPVVYPEHLTEELDYELELAVVLKKAGKWFSPEEAADYIGGYVIFNDITARDIQRGEMRSGVFSFCKAIDTFCPLGPWIVTPDEIGDPHDLAMELRVNGEVRQESHSGRMSVTIPEILSNFSALGYSAGDVLSTGTVSGRRRLQVAGGAALLYLKPGDVIEAEIERIGVLRNPVVSWQDAHGEPAPPRIRPWGDA